MTEQTGHSSSLALAREPSADQPSDLLNSAPPGNDAAETDLHDISTILLGAQASTGKAITAAGRMTVGEEARLHTRDEQQQRREQEARELANLAHWNAEMTTVGGLSMTNEQAQQARQNVIDHDKAYADWAVRQGLIRADEREEFLEAVRRKKDLEDKRGRGTMTAAEAAEEARLDRSRIGNAVDAATAHDHEHQGVAPSVETRRADADRAMRGTTNVLDRPALFQSAPNASAAFRQASEGEPDRKPDIALPVSPAIKATGLNL